MSSTMIFPSYVNGQFVDDKGSITPDWNIYMDQLTTQLQQTFNREGYFIPSQPTTVITDLATPQSNQRMLFDETTEELKFNVNGVWKIIPLT